MTQANDMSGALAPVVTPFTADLAPDAARLEQQCRQLLAEDCGLALFGTNSEGNSLSVDEKIRLLDHLADAGLPTARMMPGVGHCAVSDTIRLTRHAVSLGCGGVLMLPPFFYKDVDDEGLFRTIAHIIDGSRNDGLRIYLYHIPPTAVVGFSHELIRRLIDSFPTIIAGIKDSSGDFNNTRRMLELFPGWGIFCGNELNLLEAMRLGAKGCISATCNINASRIAQLANTWRTPRAASLQDEVNAVRKVIAEFPMIPSLKAVVARRTEDAAWHNVRPPLLPLTEQQRGQLYAKLDTLEATLTLKRDSV